MCFSSACCCSQRCWCTDQAESDYEDEDILNSPELSSQDNDRYHGKGWQTKKARAPSQAVSMLPTNDEMHTVYLEEQAIWRANAEPHVTKQDANSQQSSSTVYAEEAPVTSRLDHLQNNFGSYGTHHHTNIQCLRSKA